MPCVVADTSPLFYLARLRRFSLLESLDGSVHVPETVWQETLAGGRLDSEIPPMLTAARASGWLTVHPVPPPLPCLEPHCSTPVNAMPSPSLDNWTRRSCSSMIARVFVAPPGGCARRD